MTRSANIWGARLGDQLTVGGETTGGKIATFEVLRALPYACGGKPLG
jgi:hypothetical protein